MAIRVDHRDARVPAPTPHLLEAMAAEGLSAYSAAVSCDDEPLTTALWGKLDEKYKTAWRLAAKAMYGTLAAKAGAKVKHIREGR